VNTKLGFSILSIVQYKLFAYLLYFFQHFSKILVDFTLGGLKKKKLKEKKKTPNFILFYFILFSLFLIKKKKGQKLLKRNKAQNGLFGIFLFNQYTKPKP
jgi:predicted MPP superfamily phosphohydrolase